MMKSYSVKNVKCGTFILLFLVCISLQMQSQVTIGTISAPLKGTLLDLKESDAPDGNANSTKGMTLPRVFLTDENNLFPMLTGTESDYEALKSRYTGLIVYNVNPNVPFEKGLYSWDGSQWNHANVSSLKNITVENGISFSGSNVRGAEVIQLGGDLVKNTVINLNDSNLIFTRIGGKIGIGTNNPQSILHIENPDSIDPLILQNLKFVTDPNNAIDDPYPTYYNLKVSEKGVLRKVKPPVINLNEPFVYDLSDNTTILPGDATNNGATGLGGSELFWTGPGGLNHDYITLPEDGAYTFSFSLYGSYTLGSSGSTNLTESNSFYICALKGGINPATDIADIAEIVINHAPASSGYFPLSYSIYLTVSGKAGDAVHFKISSNYDRRNYFTWTLDAGKTSLIYWRL